MSRGYAELFSVNLGRSRILFVLLIAMHGVAVGAVLTVTQHLLVAPTAVALLIVSAVYYLRRDALRNLKRSIVALRHRDDAVAGSIWELQFAYADTWQPVTLSERFIHPLGTIVLVKAGARRRLYPIVIVCDAVAAKAFAELRGRLRSVRSAKLPHPDPQIP